MGNTPNHEYNMPSAGTSDWHIPLNENFEKLDSDIEIRGKEANKQDYDPKVGSKYEATDTGAIYYGDGENWILVDREFDQLQAENISITQIQNHGPLIVSPSINAGYDSLQVALDDAAAGKSNEIWLAEDIAENVKIPDINWWNRGGLKIRGVSAARTSIKDEMKDGTPIIEVEGGIARLTLENLELKPDGENVKSFTVNGDGSGASLQICHFSNSDFYAPVILPKVYHTYFENCRFRPYVGAERGGYDKPIYPGLMINAGNQYMFDRCHFIDRTGKLRYGTCWLSGCNSAVFNSCFFSISSGTGYDKEADRPTAPLLIDTGGDMIFNLPYCEVSADFGMVTDAIEGGGSAIDNITINGSRIGSIKLNNTVFGFVVDKPYRNLEVDMTGDGKAVEGSYINAPGSSSVNVLGDDKGWIRLYEQRAKGWDVPTPSLPVDGNSVRTNNYSVPVLIYQSGAEGTRIEDFDGEWRTIPDDSGPIHLGLNERIDYETSFPDEWIWYGMK